jgi:hypothetical protein
MERGSKVVFLVVILLVLVAEAVQASATEPSELLRYEVTWNGSKAGHGDITTRKNSGQVNVMAQAVSDGVLKALLEIWSRVQATFTANTFKPQTYSFHLKSNLLRAELVDLTFDHNTKTVQVMKQSGDEKEAKSENSAGVYDPITAVFLLRSQKDLSRPLFVDIFDGKDRARLLVRPMGSEQVHVRAGFHRAICLDLKLVKLGGDKKEIGSAKLWVSDDKFRIPLLLTSSPLVGSIRCELVHAQM